MNFEKSTILVVISRFISNGLGFIGTIYYARELGPAILGSFFLLQSLVGILGIPADLGVQGALEKRLSEGENQNKLYSASLLLLFLTYITVFTLSFTVKGYINEHLGAQLFWELFALLLVAILTQLYLSALRGELKVIQSALLRVFKELFTLTVILILLILEFRIYALIYGVIAGHIAIVLLSIYFVDLSLRKPEAEHFSRIFSFSKYNMILRTSGLIYSWTDIVVIGWFLSNSAVGVYEIAWRLSMVSILASDAIANIIFPNFSNLHNQDELAEIKRTINKAITYSLIIPLGIFFGSLVLSRDLLSILYGPAFASGATVLVLLLGERIVHSFYKTLFNVTLAFDQPSVAFRISAISIIVNIILNVALVPIRGIEGAALAMLVAYLISALLYYRHVSREISFELPIRNVLWMVFAGMFITPVLILIDRSVGGYSLYSLIFVIIVGGLLYIGVVLIKTNIQIPYNPLKRI